MTDTTHHQIRRSRGRVAVVALAAFAALGAACTAPPEPTPPTVPDDRIVITDDAHLDVFSVELHGDHLHLGVDHANQDEVLDPADVVLEVGAANQGVIGSQAGFSVLGAAGAPLWTLDGGWSVHGALPGDLAGDSLQLELISVEGPGRLGVWRFDAFGEPTFNFTSTQPFPQSLTLGHHAHAHRNWSFTEAGTYTVRAEVTAQLAATGQAITSGVEEYTFVVGGSASS